MSGTINLLNTSPPGEMDDGQTNPPTSEGSKQTEGGCRQTV